jgi:hypothetical protein
VEADLLFESTLLKRLRFSAKYILGLNLEFWGYFEVDNILVGYILPLHLIKIRTYFNNLKKIMDTYSAWWGSLTILLKVYWAIAIPFTIFFLLQMIMSFAAGGDHPDMDVDQDVEADDGIPFQFLTLKNMVGFFTIFSWTGIAFSSAGWSQGFSLTFATLAGLAMMTFMASIFFFMTKLNSNGTMKFSEAIGKVGEVYLSIPPKRGQAGKIQLVVGGLLRTLDAVTDEEENIPTGKQARVSQVLDNNILLVTSK